MSSRKKTSHVRPTARRPYIPSPKIIRNRLARKSLEKEKEWKKETDFSNDFEKER